MVSTTPNNLQPEESEFLFPISDREEFSMVTHLPTGSTQGLDHWVAEDNVREIISKPVMSLGSSSGT